jgi:hypothetical protein
MRAPTFLAALAAANLCAAAPAIAETFDLVIAHARVIDPESSLDAIRDIGVDGGRVAALSSGHLDGRTVLEARGLVAAPGFIDLHSHAYGAETAGYQAMDGVTTRLELEAGVFPVKVWYAAKAGRELINYGASVSHTAVRNFLQEEADGTPHRPRDPFASPDEVGTADHIHEAVPASVYARLTPMLDAGLAEGAIGIGSLTQYAPGITHQELLDVTRLAGQRHTCLFTHIRYGSLVEPGSTLEAVQENIANAAVSGACVHIVHINSMAMSSSPAMVALFHQARDHGVDISTEMYPWDASFDQVRSVIFDPGWEQRWGVRPEDLQSRSTGRRLTRAEFDALRAGKGDDGVLMHMNTEATLRATLQDPLVLVASDSVDIADDNSHPRSAGTFSRVLGHYVRETRAISLNEAIRKMSLMPAQRLEGFVPAMARKGRLKVGADADIVVFDPATVNAGADYLHAKAYSVGMRYVLVGGAPVVRDGRLVPGAHPGQPVYSKFKAP